MDKIKPIGLWISAIVGALTILTTVVVLSMEVGSLRSTTKRLIQENIEIRKALNEQREVMAGLHSLDQRVLERLGWMSEALKEVRRDD